MNVKQLTQNFNQTGVFPTDSQLASAIKGNPDYHSIYHLEIELVNIAIEDTNHPYHSKVVSEVKEEREFINAFRNLI
jgi:hypothetical protein